LASFSIVKRAEQQEWNHFWTLLFPKKYHAMNEKWTSQCGISDPTSLTPAKRTQLPVQEEKKVWRPHPTKTTFHRIDLAIEPCSIFGLLALILFLVGKYETHGPWTTWSNRLQSAAMSWAGATLNHQIRSSASSVEAVHELQTSGSAESLAPNRPRHATFLEMILNFDHSYVSRWTP
jgi:hypothetical protein